MTTGQRVALALGLLITLAVVAVVVIVALVSLLTSGGLSLGGERVALVRVEGFIDDLERQVDLVRQYADDPAIRAIVVRVNSGGGTVGSSQELHRELLRADEIKPVIISLGNIAASGGYYVALGGRRIIANPGTITGSIGVLFTHADTSGLLQDRLGIEVTEVTSRDNKDIASMWGPLSDEDRVLLEEMIQTVHGQFVGAVRDSREEAIRGALARMQPNRPAADVTDAEIDAHLEALCDGRPFSGEQALALGFVDGLGSLRDAIDQAAQAAGIVGEPAVIEWQPRQGLFGPLVHGLSGAVATSLREELQPRASLRYEMSLP